MVPPTVVALRATDPVTRLGVTSILGADRRVKVVTEAEVAGADVIIVVEESIDEEVFGFLRRARAESQARCVIVTDHFRDEALLTAIECGMAALVRRSGTTGEELVQAILAVSQGAGQLPPRLQGNLLAGLDRLQRDMLEPIGLTLSGLSTRERDVLRLMADGHDTEEIAAKLAYSGSTVKNVLHGVMSRCGLNTRAHAVAFAVRTGAI